MHTLIGKFNSILTSPTNNNKFNEICQNALENHSVAFELLEKPLHENIKLREGIAAIDSDNEQSIYHYNPLRLEELISDALIRLERCNTFVQQHVVLRQNINTVIEKLLRIRAFEITDYEKRIKNIGKLKPQEKEGITEAQKLESLNELINNSKAAHETSRKAYQTSSAADRLDKKVEGSTIMQSTHNFDVKKKVIRDSLAVDMMLSQHTTLSQHHSNVATYYQNYIQRIKEINNSSVMAREKKYLETSLSETELLLEQIIQSHTTGGVLDFDDRLELLNNYYQRDFLSAYKRLKSFVYGYKLIFNKDISANFNTNQTLPSTLIETRNIIDKLSQLTQTWNRTMFQFEVNKLSDFLEFPINKISGSFYGERILMLSSKSNTEPLILEIIPPKVKGFQPSSFVITSSPMLAISNIRALGIDITNIPLGGKWAMNVLSGDSAHEITFTVQGRVANE